MGWTPPDLSASSCQLASCGVGCQRSPEGVRHECYRCFARCGCRSRQSVFQLVVADGSWRVVESHRLTRAQFERWFINRPVALVIMEACGSAHHWARWLNRLGIEVRLLPAAYIRAYVKRNKTDAADACALLEAARCTGITPVRVKSIEQQALQGLHRIRSLWMATRTSRINALHGFCREFGISSPRVVASASSRSAACSLIRMPKCPC